MSILIGVWINSKEAKLFRFSGDEVELVHMKPHGPIHHAEKLGMNHAKAEGDTEKFYHQVVSALEKDADSKWYLMGFGLGHVHFAHHVQKHHPHFTKNIVGSKNVDHQTDAQIKAEAQEFFRTSGLAIGFQ